MAFKTYKLNILIRLTLIAANCLLVAWLYYGHNFPLTLVNLSLLLALQIFMLFRFLTGWQRELAYFAGAVSQNDFSVTFSRADRNHPYHEMFEVLNSITRYVRKIKTEAVQQNHFLNYIVDNIPVGLLGWDRNEKIILINGEALKLLGRTHVHHLHDLDTEPALFHEIKTMSLLQPKVVTRGTNNTRISLRLSEMIIENEPIFLLSLLNIRNELEENEMRSWSDLIAVLTHEIMNSLAPIHSLTGSLLKHVGQIEGNSKLIEKAKNSLEVIQRRSYGLMGFAERYRKISSVPLPHLAPVETVPLMKQVVSFMEEQLKGISVTVGGTSETVLADAAQLEQVLINLVRNAVYAVEEAPQRKLNLTSGRTASATYIAVRDTGSGIKPEVMERIFIPFYTTRKDGSGIGLTLSRQIMFRHGGNIEVASSEGSGTTVTLFFPAREHINA